ncbi:MAG: glycosyltransferase family 4 protein [Bacteroidota bacterium]
MGKIVVNGRFLSRRVTGVERYGREILSHIGSRCTIEETRTNGSMGHAWEQFLLPVKLPSKSTLWSPANTGPLLFRNQALTIHDLSPLEHPEYFTKSFSTWYCFFLPILAKRARIIFTPSWYVERKIKERFGIRNVIVTPNGVNTTCFSPAARQTLCELPEQYILFVGSLQPRKNLAALLKTWKQICHEYPNLWLVIGGDRGSVFNAINLPPGERVHYLGYVAEQELPAVYARALLFVLPSLDEGFGLSALEAMACGTPVIVSDGGALPEVAGNAAMVFKRSDPGSLSTAIRECLEDAELRASLIANGFERIKLFSWQESAELIWKTLNEI